MYKLIFQSLFVKQQSNEKILEKRFETKLRDNKKSVRFSKEILFFGVFMVSKFHQLETELNFEIKTS